MSSRLQQLIKPPALKPGDRVGLIAPASRPESPAVVQRCTRIVEAMGLRPVLGKFIMRTHGYMAGRDAERLEDLNSMIDDPTISAIFCLTGGFGSIHLLPHVQYSTLQKSPKVIVGGDDNAHLLLAISTRTGLVTFSGPNVDQIDSKYTFDRFKQAVAGPGLEPVSAWDACPDRFMPSVYSPVEGTAEGTVLGGNLTALVSLMGTPFQPRFQDSVLFLEDLNERHDILDRWFTTLYVSGELAKTSGIAFGAFEGCSTKDSRNMLSLEDLFGDRLKAMNKPCCFGMPIGQSKYCATVPIGIRASLQSAAGMLEFAESALS